MLLEGSLRLIDYGTDLSLFVKEEIDGTSYWVMNPDLKSRYFARTGFSPNMSTDYFRIPKPTGTFRIICLGGSTTIGFPYGQSGSFAAFLRERLRTIFPGRTTEVINLGMTATNSFTVNDLVRDLEAAEPDLLVVYDGHNEFYGALGVASSESLGSRGLTKAYLRLIHIRTFQLLRNLLADLFRGEEHRQPAGTMMERLARGSAVPFRGDLYHRALDYFRENLEELRETALKRKIPLILSTQVSNLRDQPPFLSGRNPDLAPGSREIVERSLAAAAALERTGKSREAVGHYEEAIKVDSMQAQAHYRLARNLDTLGERSRALTHYQHARDLDELRFRTSSDFNDAIRALEVPGRIMLADLEGAFAAHSPDSITGSNLILEHLHPNLSGSFLMAREIAALMRRSQLLGTSEEWLAADTISDATHWSKRLTTLIDELAARKRIALLTSGFPFRPGEAQAYTPPADPRLALIVDELVGGRATWEESHVRAAEYFDSINNLENAATEYRALVHQLRYNTSSYYRLAVVYARGKNIREAREILFESLLIDSTSLAFQLLGRITLEHDGAEAAIPFLEKAFHLSNTVDDRAECGYFLALAYVQAGRADQAIEPLDHVLRVKPDFPAARSLRDRIGKGSP